MRLYAVVIPPLERVNELFRRLRVRNDDSLTWEPPSLVRTGLCSFGNVILADFDRLTTRLSDVAARTAPFDLRFAGGGALEDDGDDSVWAGLGGDVDGLRSLALSISGAARSDGFSVDRRWFRPRARLARINDATTVGDLQQTVEALTAHEGDSWRVAEVALIEARPVTGEKSQTVKLLEVLPLNR